MNSTSSGSGPAEFLVAYGISDTGKNCQPCFQPNSLHWIGKVRQLAGGNVYCVYVCVGVCVCVCI